MTIPCSARRPGPATPASIGRRLLLPALALLAASAAALPAQSAGAASGVVTPERENFRAAPSGPILAEVLRDTRLGLGEVRDRWREATLEGWIWAPSVREEAVDGHDLVVSAASGENLRASPNGDRIARVRNGMRLDRLEERDNWIRVRRTGWIWLPSMRVDAAPAESTPAVPTPEPNGTETPAPAASAASAGAGAFATVTARGAVVRATPAGDSLARLSGGRSVQVLAREGDWTRVRVEGWVFSAALGTADTSGAVLVDISRDSLQSRPERFRGRLVEWTVQFISIQEAERFRTDFLEGEPFMLARGPGEESGFVYVAVPQEELAAVRNLNPLQRVRIVARVRTVRSSLTEAPVVELVEILRRPNEAR